MKKKLLIALLCVMGVVLCGGCARGEKLAMADSAAVTPGRTWSLLNDLVPGDGILYCGQEGEDRTYELHARDGLFCEWDKDGQYTGDLVVEGSGPVWWECFTDPAADSIWEGDRTFIEVYIKEDNRYVGYAVVSVDRAGGEYKATVLECKEALERGLPSEGLPKAELQKRIDAAIQNV